MFHSVFELAAIVTSILHIFYTLSILKISHPLTLILISINVFINTIAFTFVLYPVTIIKCSIMEIEFSLSMWFTVHPVSIIFVSVRPEVYAITITNTFLCHLTMISRIIIKLLIGFNFQCRISNKFIRFQCHLFDIWREKLAP